MRAQRCVAARGMTGPLLTPANFAAAVGPMPSFSTFSLLYMDELGRDALFCRKQELLQVFRRRNHRIYKLKRGIYFERSTVGVLHMGELGAMEALDFQRASLAGNR